MQEHKTAYQEMKMNLIVSGFWMSKPMKKKLTLIFIIFTLILIKQRVWKQLSIGESFLLKDYSFTEDSDDV